MAVVKRYATYEDLEEAPDTMVAELIEGDLIVSPRPASPHARSATVLGSDLLGSFVCVLADPSRDVLRTLGGHIHQTTFSTLAADSNE